MLFASFSKLLSFFKNMSWEFTHVKAQSSNLVTLRLLSIKQHGRPN